MSWSKSILCKFASIQNELHENVFFYLLTNKDLKNSLHTIMHFSLLYFGENKIFRKK